jgi:hypothetical protein
MPGGLEAQILVVDPFVEYARALEVEEKRRAAKYLEPRLGLLSDEQRSSINHQIIDTYVGGKPWGRLKNTCHRLGIELLQPYVLLGLPLSLHHGLSTHGADLTDEGFSCLIESAFYGTFLMTFVDGEQSRKTVLILLELVVMRGSGVSQTTFESLNPLIQDCVSAFEIAPDLRDQIYLLWHQLRNGK